MSDDIDKLLGKYEHWPNPEDNLRSYGIHWKIKAEEFRKASEALWRQMNFDWKLLEIRRATGNVDTTNLNIQVDSVYILLIGFSLENLLKGILIHKRPENINGSRLTGHNFNKHKLLEVANECDITLNEHEKQLCDICSVYINGYGRYPIPKKMKDKIQSMYLSYGKINTTYVSLFKRLSEIMEASGALTWPGHKRR